MKPLKPLNTPKQWKPFSRLKLIGIRLYLKFYLAKLWTKIQERYRNGG